MAAEPAGTHDDLAPMAAPRPRGRNHTAMTAGAITAMKLVPMPSVTRLTSRLVMSALRAPHAAPITIELPARRLVTR